MVKVGMVQKVSNWIGMKGNLESQAGKERTIDTTMGVGLPIP
jgi:hypothetical protein